VAGRASRSGSRKNAVDGDDSDASAQKHWDTTSDHGRTGGSGDTQPGRCDDRHQDSGRTTKTALQEASRQCSRAVVPGPGLRWRRARNWSRIRRNELMWRAGEGPLPAYRSQAVWRLLELATMSVIWGNSENIYSVRVLLLVTQSGHRGRRQDALPNLPAR